MKQEKNKTDTYLFLIDVDSEEVSRDIVESSGMLLLSITKYVQPKYDFGPMYIKIFFKWSEYEIVSSTSFTLKDLCLFFVRCGLDVITLNSFTEPQTPDQINRIISFCKNTYQEEKEQERLLKLKTQEDENQKYFEDHMLKKAKISLVWALEKVDFLFHTTTAYVPAKDRKRLDDQLNELKKQRMWSNYEKIKVLMQDLFVFLWSLEDAHYASLENDDSNIFAGTSVSNHELEKQVDVLEEIKYWTAFGGSVTGWRLEYVNLSSLLPYFLFIKQDFHSIFLDISLVIYRFFDVLMMIIVLSFVFLAFILSFNKFLVLGISLTSVYYYFVSLSWFALILYLASWFRIKKNTTFLVGLLSTVFIVYFITISLVQNSFTLK